MIAAGVQTPDGKSVIKWKHYGDEEWKTSNFAPYFYVDSGEEYTLPLDVDGKVDREAATAYDGTTVDRVVTRSVHDINGEGGARSYADNHYEADIPYVRRWFIDEVQGGIGSGEEGGDLDGEQRPHVAHVDIEVDTRGGPFPDQVEASNPVITISMYSDKWDSHADFLLKPDGFDIETTTDEEGRECYHPEWDSGDAPVFVFDEEADLLSSFASVVRKSGVEVLTGWNFEDFDAVYLINRMARVPGADPDDLSPIGEAYHSEWYTEDGERNLNAYIDGVDIFDMMAGYKHAKWGDNPPNWRLSTVADHEGLDVGKIPFDTSRVGAIWEEDPDSVMEYNHRDAELTALLDDEMALFEQFLVFHRELAVPLADTIKNSVLVEMFVMSRIDEWDVDASVLDSKTQVENSFEGGNTKDPVPGAYEWVFSVDVTSEYPNWVRAANISKETVVTPGDERWGDPELIDSPIDGVKFVPHDDRMGILPRAVDEMFDLKARKTELRESLEYGSEAYKRADRERDVSKGLLNSVQGVSGMETHRLSKPEVAAAITSYGRETVEFMKEVGEDWDYQFLYADTDSAFFHDPTKDRVGTKTGAVDAAHSLAEEVNDRLPEWAREEYGIVHDNRHHLEVEPDKVAKRAFFPNKKKRYTLWLAWKDGKDVDYISHTGWAIVRSDASEVEERIQRKTLEAMMHNKGQGYITARLREEMDTIVQGNYDPVEVARPQGSSKAFSRYGPSSEVDFEGVPYFVAAMLSSNELLGTAYSGGDKAYLLPVKETKTVELNGTTNEVNYLAIDEDTELPSWAEPDTEKILDNIIGKVDRIYESMGWDLSRRESVRNSARNVDSRNMGLGAFSSD